MANQPHPTDCPDCREEGLSRRAFVRAASLSTVAGLVLPGALPQRARATPPPTAESAAQRLYATLRPEQKAEVCFPFDHERRRRVHPNWAVSKLKIESDFTPEQQALIREIFQGVTSPEGYERFMTQMEEDSGGFGQYHIGLFGEPGSGQFEFLMTGRHLTIRADGDCVEGAAFGGPIIYGHGAGDSEKGLPGNVFYYQTQKANEVFQALDGTQRTQALLPNAPPEAEVSVQGNGPSLPGLRVGTMSADQKALVESVIKILLNPYRQTDVDEALELIKTGGGLDAMHMSFYETDDLGHDQEWDIWRLEGPTFVWHFRGAPHVHAYANIALKSER